MLLDQGDEPVRTQRLEQLGQHGVGRSGGVPFMALPRTGLSVAGALAHGGELRAREGVSSTVTRRTASRWEETIAFPRTVRRATIRDDPARLETTS